MVEVLKVLTIGIINPSDEQFRRLPGCESRENCPKNWGPYYDAVEQWIRDHLGFLILGEAAQCSYWVAIKVTNDSEAVRTKLREALPNDPQKNPFGIDFHDTDWDAMLEHC